MRITEIVFLAVVVTGLVVLTAGLSRMTIFENTAEGLAEQTEGANRLFGAGLLLFLAAGTAVAASSPVAAALTAAVAVSAALIGALRPSWLPPLALLAQAPALALATGLVLAA